MQQPTSPPLLPLADDKTDTEEPDEQEEQEEQEEQKTLDWRVPCPLCPLLLVGDAASPQYFHIASMSRHFKRCHPGHQVTEEIRVKLCEYSHHCFNKRRKLGEGGCQKNRKKVQPHRRRKHIALPQLPEKTTTSGYVQFLKSAFGGACKPNYAEELGSILSKILQFERKLSAPALTDVEIDALLADTARLTRLFSHLELENGSNPGTVLKWHSAALKGCEWRVHELTKITPHTPEIAERIRALKTVPDYFNRYTSTLSKQKKQIKDQSSMEERLENGTWASLDDFKNAVEQASHDFEFIVQDIKTNQAVDSSFYNTVLEYCMAVFYSENRPTRPGVISALTLADWLTIRSTGKFSTRAFKTNSTYGEQAFSFGPQTLAVWESYVIHVRPLMEWHSHVHTLFAQFLGGPLHVARCLSHFSSVYMSKHITPTDLRAMVATEAEDHLPEEKAAAIHRADAHSIRVVKAHYDKKAARRVAEQADEAYQELRGRLHGGADNQQPKKKAVKVEVVVLDSESDEEEAEVPVQEEEEEEGEREQEPRPLPRQRHPKRRIPFEKEEVLFLCSWMEKHPDHPLWSEAAKIGKAKGRLHPKRTGQNLKDCWRSVQNGAYMRFGVDHEGRCAV